VSWAAVIADRVPRADETTTTEIGAWQQEKLKETHFLL
jgi:hypothetical protein